VRRISGRSINDFARERIFEPLGMKDTCYMGPASIRRRIIRRPADAPWAEFFLGEWAWPLGSTGVFSTAMDMAIFGQMFLNRGSYGDARVLSPASVAAMTRNQVPGIGARYGEEVFTEACWGFGWGIHGDKKVFGTLQSPETLSHGGSGGVFMWVDPVCEMVGVYFSVTIQGGKWNVDLFMNAVTAAITEE
jgi:CubicO group peptidase (beta-lactamase class C family)